MTDHEALRTLKLSIQQALLGEVTRRLHSVTCGVSTNLIRIRAYFDGSIVPEDVERIQMVGTEVIATFPVGYMIEESCLSLGDGEEEVLDFWAFRRASE